MSEQPIDPSHFRTVLGHFPTGVVVVAAVDEGEPVGLAIGSFSSVSLDPPLVAFFPGRQSSSWPRIRNAGHFSVNVLGEHQEDVCRRFASKDGDKFTGLGWHPASSGSPLLDGATAWIDCDIERVVEVGDHDFVVGKVRELDVAHEAGPLLFYRGGYGRLGV